MRQHQPVKRQDPSLSLENIIIIGASGSGKSSFLREQIDFNQNRIIAWDPEEDYRLPRVRDLVTFKRVCAKAGFGKIRVALTVDPNEENFEVFAGVVFALAHAKAKMTVLCDEIADVTRVSKASPNWGQLCRKGRKYGVKLCAITQRPQECDKTIFNQVMYKWCGALGSMASYKSMSDEMDVPISELKALENIDGAQIQYWLRKGTQQAEKHTIKFPKKRAARKKISTKAKA